MAHAAEKSASAVEVFADAMQERATLALQIERAADEFLEIGNQLVSDPVLYFDEIETLPDDVQSLGAIRRMVARYNDATQRAAQAYAGLSDTEKTIIPVPELDQSSSGKSAPT